MARKQQFVALRSGIYEPKHIRALGNAFMLYTYMLNLCEWSTGIVYSWTDGQAAKDLGLLERTVRDQRQHIADRGYIKCKRGWQCLDITISNWVDPRSYGGRLMNRNENLDLDDDLLDTYSDIHSDTNTDTNPVHQSVELPIDQISNIKGQIDSGDKSPAPAKPAPSRKKAEPDPDLQTNALKLFKAITGRYPPKINYGRVIERFGEYPDGVKAKKCFEEWSARGYKPTNLAWLDWYITGIPDAAPPARANGKVKPTEPAGFDGIRRYMQQEGMNGN